MHRVCFWSPNNPVKYLYLLVAILGCIFLPAPYNYIGWAAIVIQIFWFLRASLRFYK